MNASLKTQAFQRVESLKKFLTPREVFALKLSLIEDNGLVKLLSQEKGDMELLHQIKDYCNSTQEKKSLKEAPGDLIPALVLLLAAFGMFFYLNREILSPAIGQLFDMIAIHS